MINVAIFVSGRGSNLQAIINYFYNKPDKIDFKTVFSDKVSCPALDFAKKNGIKTFSIKKNSGNGIINWEKALEILTNEDIDLIVLAGFLKKIPNFIINEFRNKIINIHPALLPSFGGKGMYGMNVHKAVFESSATVSGVTIHFVNEKYDEGKIIAQKCVDISNVNSPEDIAERVLNTEHRLLPKIIEKFAENKILIKNKRVVVL